MHGMTPHYNANTHRDSRCYTQSQPNPYSSSTSSYRYQRSSVDLNSRTFSSSNNHPLTRGNHLANVDNNFSIHPTSLNPLQSESDILELHYNVQTLLIPDNSKSSSEKLGKIYSDMQKLYQKLNPTNLPQLAPAISSIFNKIHLDLCSLHKQEKLLLNPFRPENGKKEVISICTQLEQLSAQLNQEHLSNLRGGSNSYSVGSTSFARSSTVNQTSHTYEEAARADSHLSSQSIPGFITDIFVEYPQQARDILKNLNRLYEELKVSPDLMNPLKLLELRSNLQKIDEEIWSMTAVLEQNIKDSPNLSEGLSLMYKNILFDISEIYKNIKKI